MFARERWWLEAKNVIDLEGNAWRPKVDAVAQIIEDEDEPCAHSTSMRKKRKTNHGSAIGIEKRPVSIIDLTGGD